MIKEPKVRTLDEMPEVLSIFDLAEILRCCTRTIERRIEDKGNLPSRLPSIDGSHRWARETVRQWLQNPGALWKSGHRRIA